MPKVKTKRSAAKRFSKTASGKIKRGSAFRRHILTKKTTKSMRHLRGQAYVHESNQAQIERLIPYK